MIHHPAIASTCSVAGISAAAKYGVPERLIIALIEAESGGNHLATRSDQDGARVHDSTAAAADYLRSRAAVDVGCMQINTHWHPEINPESLLDPVANTDYGARYLAELFHKFGSWSQAVAAYNSGKPANYAYQCQIARRLIVGYQCGGPLLTNTNPSATVTDAHNMEGLSTAYVTH